MCTPLISFDTVREIMTNWMAQYIEEWTNEGSRWNYESNVGDFEWYKYGTPTSEGIRIGANLSDQGTVITIWTGTMDNDSIIISRDNVFFNDHSNFDQGFHHGKMFYLYTLLKSHALSISAKLVCYEPIEDEITDEHTGTPKGVVVRTKFDLDYFELYKAYTVYDNKHAILRNVTENMLTFIYYDKTGPSWLYVSIDDYLNKKFTIKPLVDNEQ